MKKNISALMLASLCIPSHVSKAMEKDHEKVVTPRSLGDVGESCSDTDTENENSSASIKNLESEKISTVNIDQLYERCQKGDAQAMLHLGKAFYFGEGVERNIPSAFSFFSLASQKERFEADYYLGIIFSNIDEITQCYRKDLVSRDGYFYRNAHAFNLIKNSAQNGFRDAQYNFGLLLENGVRSPGHIIDPNIEEALKWFELAAEQGHEEAQFKLNDLGQTFNKTSKKYNKYLEFAIELAEQENLQAQKALGNAFYKGVEANKDWNEAYKWFLKAAEQGDATSQNTISSMLITGWETDDGLKVRPDPEKAFYWVKKAAEQGDINAQSNISHMLRDGWKTSDGVVVKPNLEQAIFWLEKAAEGGHTQAQFNLGASYFNGSGVPQNYEKAQKWFELAAKNGYPSAKLNLGSAQLNLGAAYYHGQGTHKNISLACKWFLAAAENNNDKARKNLKQLLSINSTTLKKSDKLFDLSTFDPIHQNLDKLFYHFGLFQGLTNHSAGFGDSLENFKDLHDQFFIINELLGGWVNIANKIKLQPTKLLLSCLNPADNEIRGALLGSLSDGISAHNFSGQFLISFGDDSAKLARSIMESIQTDCSIDQTIKGLETNRPIIAQFLSNFEFDQGQELTVDIIIQTLTDFKGALSSFVTDNAQARNDAFIQTHDWWK